MKSFYEKFTLCHAPEGDGGSAGGAGADAGAAGGVGSGGSNAGVSSGQAANGGSGGDSGQVSSGGNSASGGGGQAGPLLDQQGNFTKGWSKSLGVSDSLEAKFSSPKSLAASYADLEKLIGAKGIIKPSATATPEQREAYLNNFRPATAKDYGFDKPIEKITVDGKEVAVPKELYDGANAGKFAELAHKVGLTPEQAKAVVEFDLQRGIGAKGNFEKLMADGKAAGENALKAAWGADYAKNLEAAKAGAAALGMTAEEMADPSLGNNPGFLKALANAAGKFKEDPTAGNRGNQSDFRGDPAAEIKRIMNDPNDLWQGKFKHTDPAGHKARVEHMAKLFELKGRSNK